MSKYFLGLFGYGPNPSAALVRDGTIVGFAEEERFNRIKTAPASLPLQAARYCLQEAGISMDQVEATGFAWDCEAYQRDMPALLADLDNEHQDDDAAYNHVIQQAHLNLYHPERVRWDLSRGFAAMGERLDPRDLRFMPHHLCHAASAFYASGFESAAVMTVDGSGEDNTTFLWHAQNGGIEELQRWRLPHSLGGFYSLFTEYLGFRPYQDEGKLMGLAAYGQSNDGLESKLDDILSFDPNTGDFRLDPVMRHRGHRTIGRNFTDKVVDIFGPPRLRGEPLTDNHRDLAAAVQKRLESVVLALGRQVLVQTGERNICLAGGSCMNCKMNGQVSMLDGVDCIFVQPAAADNGVALGAAYLLAHEAGIRDFEPMRHAYWGPQYSNDEVESAIRESKLPAEKRSDIPEFVAEALDRGKIVGWFQGRMEIGARALGARSILANPLDPTARDKVNREVKHRESWRPFCPSLIAEAYPDYFGPDAAESPYMILAFPVVEEHADRLPSVVHVDGTARPQCVHRDANPRFHAMISEFGRRSGHPVVLNTSFNVQGEPLVCTPTDALRCFGGTGIDILVMEDFVVAKPDSIS